MDLDLSRNEIEFGPEHIDPLGALVSSRFSTLENLNVSHNMMGDEMLARLAPNLMHRVWVQRLYLDNCRLSIRGAAALFSSLKTNHSIVVISLS
jgi:Ran GTPase-activating protein (RanGAP) involved in mRNA processing and transport